MSIGGDNEEAISQFIEKLEKDSEVREEDRVDSRKAVDPASLTTAPEQEQFLFEQLAELIGRNKYTLDQFEKRIDAGDVYEGTVQGLSSTMAELNKSLDQFLKLKVHREKLEHSDNQLKSKQDHQRKENDKKLMSKGFEIGDDGGLITGSKSENYLLTGNAAEITSSEFFQELVEKVKEGMPEPRALPEPIDAEIVE